jgi:Uma2 family endonuclease
MWFMEVLVTDPREQERLIAQRRESGGDRFDEVWEGMYVMSPLADNQHQELQGRLAAAFLQLLNHPRTRVLPGANITDQEDDWEQNYRCPDVVVFLPETTAQDRESHWLGGPDFAVEILSRGDRTAKKLPFYASVNVRELLVIDRSPWSLQLYRLRDGQLISVAKNELGAGATLTSEVLPLSFRLIAGSQRPIIEVRHRESGQIWAA